MPDIDQPSWPEIFDAAIRRKLRGVHTCLPGRVISYDHTTQLASVQPTVEIEIAENVYDRLPPLDEVPILHAHGGGFFAHVPLAAGDTVLLHFAEEDYSKWFETGEIEPPAVMRKHGLYAFATPAGRRRGNAIGTTYADRMTVGKDGGPVIVVDDTLIKLGSDAASAFVALADLVDSNFTAIKDMFTNWVVVPNDGGAALKTLSNSLTLPTVAATKAKAE